MTHINTSVKRAASLTVGYLLGCYKDSDSHDENRNTLVDLNQYRLFSTRQIQHNKLNEEEDTIVNKRSE